MVPRRPGTLFHVKPFNGALKWSIQWKNKLTLVAFSYSSAFAFGIAWITGLIIYLTGGLTNSPQIVPGISLALVLLATAYMWAPALGNILTRLITREGWKDVGLRPHFKKGWPYWLAGWFLPAVMTLFGAAVFFVLFPQLLRCQPVTGTQANRRFPGPVCALALDIRRAPAGRRRVDFPDR